MNEQLKGIVKWYDKAKVYGFIVANNRDYFVHKNAIKSGESELMQGQHVIFTAAPAKKGQQAADVRVVEANGNVI